MRSICLLKRGENDTIITSCMSLLIHVKNLVETFLSELDDTVAEAQLRTKQIPPQLQTELAVNRYRCSSNRMIILVSYPIFYHIQLGLKKG
ncbi:putative alpha,alpha-trehalose-phosphate synthase (UDP-forming) [Helianthus annuus]|nr:putative alpha,alpha-trehalose-phosphate synthase (UDP-forming) [Helianthus annuus]